MNLNKEPKEAKIIKTYCIISNEFTKFKKAKILYISFKKLHLSIVYSKCGHEYKKIFKEEEPVEVLKILGLIANIEKYQKNIIMSEKNISQEFRLKNLDKTTNCLIEEINQNELMNKKPKKITEF